MPIDAYKLHTPQDDQETVVGETTAPGYAPRPHFELEQRQINVAPRGLMESDFEIMSPEARRAAENALDLQARQELDLEMFDKMNDEQAAARSQVAEVKYESQSDPQTPGVTEAMVREWSEQFMFERDLLVTEAIVEHGRNQALRG